MKQAVVQTRCLNWKDWWEMSAALSKTLRRNSRHAFRKYSRRSHPLRHGSPLPSFQHIQLVVNAQAKIPARIERFSISLVSFVRAETLLSPAATLSTLHLTWRRTSSTWSWGRITKLPAHTHPPPQFLSLACHPPTTCHHCGYILSVNLSRNTHIFLFSVSPSGFCVFNVTSWISNTILIHTDEVKTKPHQFTTWLKWQQTPLSGKYVTFRADWLISYAWFTRPLSLRGADGRLAALRWNMR